MLAARLCKAYQLRDTILSKHGLTRKGFKMKITREQFKKMLFEYILLEESELDKEESGAEAARLEKLNGLLSTYKNQRRKLIFKR